jgi:hypothetical protein
MRFPYGERVSGEKSISSAVREKPDWIGSRPWCGELELEPQNLINNPPVNARLF